ncbi:FUSC family protein [Brytella acorum]|uniref:FUSC family protein n=1 Tax=Brytella acorum TaxID=2959299 RepID=A0AA35UVU3_9PROT|nr:FUSC family protein [Brytella acorum]MDF3624132.1 FUSC family protein [Brytella acorum]CAI9120638.1 FUSC family protein [Brytella acorum]
MSARFGISLRLPSSLASRSGPPGQWAWLYAPSPQIFGFAFRTTFAALLALGIAMWMELDSPSWAAMTVWAVAQTTRGESLSKARWRLVGTVLGVLAATSLIIAFPQTPWLFFPAIAIWTGLCAGFATFVSNFRAYALVLAGYTCAIVGLSAISDPDNIFMIAMSRGTYIVLGILCEAAVGILFATSQERNARRIVRTKLQTALSLVSVAIADLLDESEAAHRQARDLFGAILRVNSDIEYAEIEMGPHGHEGDHARAALAAVSVLLSRGFGMATRLAALDHDSEDFKAVSRRTQEFLRSLGKRLDSEDDIAGLLADIHALVEECRHYAAPYVTEDETEVTLGPIDERVLFVALSELLLDLDTAISEYDASGHPVPRDHFTFRLQTHRDPRNAFNNGLRVSCAVLLTALVYEVTGWSNGQTFMTFSAVVCGLFAATENPAIASLKFLWGVVWAAIAAAILVFIFVPKFDTYEMLIVAYGPAMFLGGLARGNPNFGLQSAAYGLLMPAMVGIQNHHRLDEIQYFNATSATVLGAAAGVLVFHTFLPFNSRTERFRLRREMLSELRGLCHLRLTPDVRFWIGRNIDRFARLVRHAGANPGAIVERYIQGTLATMTLGLNIIRLRTLLDREHLPDSARRPIELLLYRLEHTRARHSQPARTARIAIRRLRQLDGLEADLVTRLELMRGISYLVLVNHVLQENGEFLDERRPFIGLARQAKAIT